MKDRFRVFGVFILGMILLGGLTLTSCKDDDDDNDDDNGVVDPNSIATTNQVYHWTFDNTPADRIANKGSVVGNVTYVAGRIGQAYQGAENAYIRWDVDSTDKIANLKAFTIAAWLKAPKVQGGPPMIFQISGTQFLGSLAFFQENAPENNTVDTLELKAFWTKEDAKDKDGNNGWVGHDWRKSLSAFVANTWFHFATSYDPSTSTAHVFVNGNHLLTVPGPYEDTVRYQGDPGGLGNPNNQPKLGDLNMALLDSANYGIIGAWGNRRLGTATDDWMTDYKGQIDELRVYDKALTKAEVKRLYEAEVAKIAP